MELGGSSLPHSQESTTCPYPSQINPFRCPNHFWQVQVVCFLIGLRTYQHPGTICAAWWLLSQWFSDNLLRYLLFYCQMLVVTIHCQLVAVSYRHVGITNSMEQSPWELIASQMVRKFPVLRNPRSLLWSQEPITCPHSEPYEPSSHSPSVFLSDPFKYYPLTMPKSLKWSLFFRFCHNNNVHIFLLPSEVPWSDHSSMPHGLSVWGTLIWSLQSYLVSSTNHEAPHAFFFLWSLLFHLRSKSLPQCHILVCCLCPSHKVRAQVTCPYKRSKMTWHVCRGSLNDEAGLSWWGWPAFHWYVIHLSADFTSEWLSSLWSVDDGKKTAVLQQLEGQDTDFVPCRQFIWSLWQTN